MARLTLPHRLLSVLLPLGCATAATANRHSPDAKSLEALRAGDLEIATIGYRLATRNAALCDTLQPALGLQIHALVQYPPVIRAAVRTHFGFEGAIGVEGVVEGSPADRAGVHKGDTVTAIGDAVFDLALPAADGPTSTAPLVAIDAAVARYAPTAEIAVGLSRAGRALSKTMQAIPACRARLEMVIDDKLDASTDGVLIQLTSPYLDRFDANGIAVTIAHELAHNILHHRVRLDAASAHGHRANYVRQTEIEADILSIDLLKNAGYDPEEAVRFWRILGPMNHRFVRAREHPDWRDRIATMQREIAAIALDPDRASHPPLLDTRDMPLDGNWTRLLVRH